MWAFLSLWSGIFDGIARGVIKKTNANFLIVALGGIIFALPLYGAALFLDGVPEVMNNFWLIVFIHAVLLTAANIAMVRAHQLSPLILTVPYLSLTSVFLLVTSPWLRGGSPNVYGFLGVVLITIGLYLSNVSAKEIGILGPIRVFKKNKGSQLMLLVAIIYSITANLDNLAIKSSSIFFYLLWDSIFVAFFLFILCLRFVAKKELKECFGNWQTLRPLSVFGAVTAMSVIPQCYAYGLAIVPYVISLKRSGVIAATIGGMIYFKEKEDAFTRVLGFLIAFGGATLITLFGIS